MTSKLTLTIALCLAVSAFAGAQSTAYDRNFQRLDVIQAKASAMKNKASSTTLMELQANVGFPDTMFSLGGSFVYGAIPSAGNGVGTWIATTSYNHSNPSGGSVSDYWSETASYEFWGNSMGNLTIGASGWTDNNGFNNVSPYLALTWAPTSDIQIIPSGTFSHTNGNMSTADGWIPDVMVTYAPATLGNLVLFADWTSATTVSGTGSVMGGFAYPIFSQLSLKFAATAATGNQTGFTGVLGWKF